MNESFFFNLFPPPLVCPQFVCLEGLVTSISDMYPSYFYIGHRRKVLLLAISLVCFLVGLFLVTEVSLIYCFLLQIWFYLCSLACVCVFVCVV